MKMIHTAALVGAIGALASTQTEGALLYSLDHNNLPASGTIDTWDGATAMGSPQVAEINGQKWSMSADGSGFRVASPTSAIPINGASFVVAVSRTSAVSNNWDSVIDVMYNKLVLGVRNDTGQINVWRNGDLQLSTLTIDEGKPTVLSMTTQTDGSYKVWADDLLMLEGGANGTMTEWDPNRLDNDGNPVPGFMNSINVSSNDPDGWPTFNGPIGDVKIFDVALSDSERLAEVSSMRSAMGIPEPSSALLLGLSGLGLLVRRRRA